MKKKDFIFITVIIVIVLFSFFSYQKNKNTSTQKPKSDYVFNQYLSEFSGGYMINVTGEIKGNETEMYVLHSNGNAEWMWIEVHAGATKILSKKTGTWTAAATSVLINIQGNTGTISEKYTFSDGKFINGDRYLVKTTN